MLISLKFDNLLVFDSEMEFSMEADMRGKRLRCNLIPCAGTFVTKATVVFGPNNSGKTNLVRVFGMLKCILLGMDVRPTVNMFQKKPLCSLSVDFADDHGECCFSFTYDASSGEYVREEFSEIRRHRGQPRSISILLRDSGAGVFSCADASLCSAMRFASRKKLLIHALDVQQFPLLAEVCRRLESFAEKIDILDMNNIPIGKTLGILKRGGKAAKSVSEFVSKSDLSMEKFYYSRKGEFDPKIDELPEGIQEAVLKSDPSLLEMLRLVSVYRGIKVPSLLHDSTGTKKLACLAGYMLDALRNGRLLVVDELDNSLHSSLTRWILALFNNLSNERSQLIATVHDVSLLDCKVLFRKEQIWFVHRDREDICLYSLADFKAREDRVRDTTDLQACYRHGELGACPQPQYLDLL